MKVKLDDVVDRITGNVDRYNTELKYYVGGEHYETSSYIISMRGLLNSEKGRTLGFKFHFPFKKGDVLFMARNPHLKKAGMVTFDGICSDASYILRTKDENRLLQKYLALVIQNERLWKFFEENKSGSVNYLMNWKELKKYEFELPSLKEQQRISDLLWAMNDTLESYKDLLAKTDEMVKSQFVEMFGSDEYPSIKLRDICSKITDGTHKTPVYINEGIPFISAKNIIDGKLVFEDIKYISSDEYTDIQKRCQISEGDLLLTKSGSLGMPALVNVNFPFGVFESLAVLKYDRKKLNGTFLHSQILSNDFQRRLLGGIKGIVVKHLHLNVIGDMAIIVPPISIQNQFAVFVQQADKSKSALQQSITSLKNLMKATINKELMG